MPSNKRIFFVLLCAAVIIILSACERRNTLRALHIEGKEIISIEKMLTKEEALDQQNITTLQDLKKSISQTKIIENIEFTSLEKNDLLYTLALSETIRTNPKLLNGNKQVRDEYTCKYLKKLNNYLQVPLDTKVFLLNDQNHIFGDFQHIVLVFMNDKLLTSYSRNDNHYLYYRGVKITAEREHSYSNCK